MLTEKSKDYQVHPAKLNSELHKKLISFFFLLETDLN